MFLIEICYDSVHPSVALNRYGTVMNVPHREINIFLRAAFFFKKGNKQNDMISLSVGNVDMEQTRRDKRGLGQRYS